MRKTKSCKILFNTLVRKNYLEQGKEEREIFPLFEIDTLIEFISKKKKKERFYDLVDNKFCFIETSEVFADIPNESKFIKGYFISARNEFRPNLINKKTGEVRKNPKELSEGDIEKTHFIIRIDKKLNEVYLFLEYNYHGITQNNFINYFTSFWKSKLKAEKLKKNFSIDYLIIPRKDFLKTLNKLKRTSIAEIYIDKKLLGSRSLNFSNRTSSVKKEIKLVVSANPRETITEVAIDFFNKFNSSSNDISKIRIHGNDFEGNNVILDTSFMGLEEFVEVDLDTNTGEVISSQLFAELQKISENI